MKDLKILIVLIFFTGLTYWGIEPYAHHIMHPSVEEPDFAFSDLKADFNNTAIEMGDPALGKEQFIANCNVCHNIKVDGLVMMSDSDLIAANGVLPPDLSNIASILDLNFLQAFLKNPVKAAFTSTNEYHRKVALAQAKQDATNEEADALLKLHQKAVSEFKAKQAGVFIKMPSFDWLGDAEIGNLIAYFKSIAKPLDELSGEEVTKEACSRCHSVDYAGITMHANKDEAKKYLGSMPPDLSQMIKSKGEQYLHEFINDPQKLLLNTGMPRLGLSEAAQTKVVSFMEEVGDPNVEARKTIGLYAILFFIVLSIFAYAWKKNEFTKIGK